ncbi:MAG: DUF885 domain-containing protein, partial [Acidimicrobiia bacterium]|nr:DUF885 domain-containing protein [Acidimicrobiia bacterium]
MNNALATLALNYYEQTLVDHPTSALMRGDHRYDDQMEDLTRESEDHRIEFLDSVVEKARSIETSDLTPAEQVTRDVLVFEAETEAGELRSRMAEFGVDPVSGFHVVFLQLVGHLPITEPEHAEAVVDKFAKFGTAFDQGIARLRQGLATDRVPVAVLCERVIGQVDGYLASPLDADPFIHLAAPQAWGEAETTVWRDNLKQVVSDTIRPAYERLRTAIAEEVLPKARPEEKAGLRWLPDGEEVYARAIHRHTSLQMPPLDIHNIGLEEIADLEREYAELGQSVLGTSDVAEIYRRLREDTTLRFETAEQVKQAGAESLARAKGEMGNWFGRLPQADCVMAEIPIGGDEAPLAFYLPPSTDGARPGTFFVNTNDPETRTRYESEALAFHESIPGHHLQLAISQELEGIEEFHKHALVNAYVEGWGLYTERLADEMGL